MNNYFKPAGDLIDNSKINKAQINKTDSNEKINNYISSVVSGIKYPDECELGTICSEAVVITNLAEFEVMVKNDCYNIIRAKYYNPEMVEVHYQKYIKTNSKRIF